MLTRPSECRGCPLDSIATGFMRPDLSRSHNGVALIGEALGETEAEEGGPFRGKAGFQLTRLLQWAGLQRLDFDIFNTVWCRPPDNKLEGAPYQGESIRHCREAHWNRLLARSRVLVPMGNVPLGALTGRHGILSWRGYVYDGGSNHIIPTVHPSYIQRGNAKWSAAFINDLQKAVELAKGGLPPQILDYTLDPSPLVALQWARAYREYLSNHPECYLSFDIETPGKPEEEDESDTDSDAPDATWHIWRIGFAYRGLEALSVPWEPPFISAIRLLLGSPGPKVVWNAGFDVPRVRRAGVAIEGTIHDGMVAWHILHSDLPKRLGFVATFTCPWQPAWKHLSGAKPAFYNATDADVELRSMVEIEACLRRTGLWEVYDRDVVQLDPILVHMQRMGMPIDGGVREDRSRKLAERSAEAMRVMESSVPLEARKIEHVYVNGPKDTTGLLSRPGTRTVPVCPGCGCQKPRKDHFKSYVKKLNPCANLKPVSTNISVEEWFRLAEFTPSRDQLIRYHNHLGRPLPMIYDRKERKKKVSFAEMQIKELMLKFPDDKLYPAVLEYRALDKIAGTYIGRPLEPEKQHQEG